MTGRPAGVSRGARRDRGEELGKEPPSTRRTQGRERERGSEIGVPRSEIGGRFGTQGNQVEVVIGLPRPVKKPLGDDPGIYPFGSVPEKVSYPKPPLIPLTINPFRHVDTPSAMQTFAHELVHVIEHMFDRDKLRDTPCECLRKDAFKLLAEFLTGRKDAKPFPRQLDLIGPSAAEFIESLFTNEKIAEGLNLTREDYRTWLERRKAQEERDLKIEVIDIAP